MIVELVSDWKALEKELVEARRSVEEAAAIKGKFLSNMSHEFRTPLNAIIGFSDLLLEEHADKESRELAQTIKNSADHLLDLVNQTLDFSRLESGKLRIRSSLFLPQEIAGVCESQFRLAAREKGLALRVEIAPAVPDELIGDGVRICQILLNLLSNAIKFTEKGRVELVVSGEPLEEGRYLLRFRVIDTGTGMPPEEISKLFEPFSQLDDVISRRHGGAGLGLAISRELAHLMGGSISVESRLGEGSTFNAWVEAGLPEVEAPTLHQGVAQPGVIGEDEEVKEDPVSTTGDGPRILLTEDNPINQKVAKALLKKLNCRITVAENEYEALEALEGSDFDLILMDCQMPVMDGLTATRKIRTLEKEHRRHLSIVAMTANAMIGDREECLAAGMDDYLSRPVTVADLRRILDKWVHMRGQ